MVCTNKNKTQVQLVNNDKQVQIFDSIHLLPSKVFEKIQHFQNHNLNIGYLKALEANVNACIKLQYAVVSNKQLIEQVYVLQFYKFDIAHFGVIKSNKNSCNLFSIKGMVNQLFVSASNCNNAQVLVIGNLFFSSEIQTVSQLQFDWLVKELKQKINYNCIVVKDINNNLSFKNRKLINVPVEPSMELPIATHWNCFNDYLQSLLPKYKKRWNNTINKNKDLQFEQLSLPTLELYLNEIYDLYLKVFNKSETLYNKIEKNYFLQMKNNLQENYQIYVYKYEDKIIGFGSYIIDKKNIIAEYVGFDDILNKSLKIYQTILYQFIAEAINNKCEKLLLGRTGIEIKSTLGAVPVWYHNYIMCNNNILHQTAKMLIKDVKQPNWEYRQPFK
jgi:hypothetical protein